MELAIALPAASVVLLLGASMEAYLHVLLQGEHSRTAQDRARLRGLRQRIEIDPVHEISGGFKIYTTRISSGIEDLDAMLRGGYLRGSTTLLSGAPGTSKTTLASRFAQASCLRGEKCLYVCFDEAPEEIVRNMGSVGTELARHVKSGRLQMQGLVARSSHSDLLASGVLALIDTFQPQCPVLDPVSAFAAAGDSQAAHDAVRLIIQRAKHAGITVLLTSLIEGASGTTELSQAHVSTLCDNWQRERRKSLAGMRDGRAARTKSPRAAPRPRRGTP